MATYTATELKDLTSVQGVNLWSDAKILLFQTAAESILGGLGLNTGITGYTDAYAAAVVLLFNWLADNPTLLTSGAQGKVSKAFTIKDLPGPVQMVLDKFTVGGEDGSHICGAKFERSDVGLR